MTDVNHHRKNKKPVNKRYAKNTYKNGYAYPNNKRHVSEIKEENDKWVEDIKSKGFTPAIPKLKTGEPGVGRTDYLDKSMHSWGRKSIFADKSIGAGIGNDFTNGRKGMAKAVKGAKKFVNSRIRFHENMELKKMNIKE